MWVRSQVRWRSALAQHLEQLSMEATKGQKNQAHRQWRRKSTPAQQPKQIYSGGKKLIHSYFYVYGSCISVGAIDRMRVSCGFGKYPHVKRAIEIARMKIARKSLILFFIGPLLPPQYTTLHERRHGPAISTRLALAYLQASSVSSVYGRTRYRVPPGKIQSACPRIPRHAPN